MVHRARATFSISLRNLPPNLDPIKCDDKNGKTVRPAPFGTPRPLRMPEKACANISVHFITGLPWSNEFDVVYIVVDQLTKMSHLIPCCSITDAPKFTRLFIQHVFKRHRLLNTVISSREF